MTSSVTVTTVPSFSTEQKLTEGSAYSALSAAEAFYSDKGEKTETPAYARIGSASSA